MCPSMCISHRRLYIRVGSIPETIGVPTITMIVIMAMCTMTRAMTVVMAVSVTVMTMDLIYEVPSASN